MKTPNDQAVSGTFSRKPLFRALEQRIMFDAAAVDTAAQVVLVKEAYQSEASPVVLEKEANQDEQAQGDAILDVLADLVPPAERDRSNVVVVDQSVANYESIIAQISDDYSVLVMPAGEGGLQSLADALSGYKSLESIHILSHGSENLFQLGNDKLTAQTVQQHADALAQIGSVLSADGDLLLYGCDLTASSEGQSLIESIATLTGADVAASADATGAEALGGDWELESTSGVIEAKTLDVEYDGLLSGATYVTTTAEGELDSEHLAGDDIDFKINVTGDLPNSTAQLVIRAYDVNDASGEVDQVYLNGNIIGTLKGAPGQWSTTTFNVPTSIILQGENSVKIAVDVDPADPIAWSTTVDWGQLLIDGGAQDQASVASAELSAVSVSQITATITSQVLVNVTTTGAYRLVAQLTNQSTREVLQIVETDFSGTAGVQQQVSLNNAYDIRTDSGVLVVSFDLYAVSGEDLVLQEQTQYTFDTVQYQGPSTAPTSADATVSFNGASGYTFTTDDFAFSDLDGDELTKIVITSVPGAGELHLEDALVNGTTTVTVAQLNAGSLKYTTASNEFGDALATFNFTVNDGQKSSEASTITFNVAEPTYINLSSNTFNQADGQNFDVATLTPFITDAGASYSYALVAGTGDTNNDLFTISGDKLVVKDSTLIAQGTYDIRLQIVATDPLDYDYEQAFSLTVTDNFAPVSISDTDNTGNLVDGDTAYHATIVEGIAEGEEIGVQLTASDPSDISYSIQGDSPFAIDAETGVISIATGGSINFEAASEHAVTVLVSDSYNNTSQFVVNVKVTNAAPTLANDTAEVTERASNATGNVLSNDQDPGSTLGEDLSVTAVNSVAGSVGQQVAGTNGGLFTIQADGSWSFDANGDFDALKDGESATTSITLSVQDSSGQGGDTTLEVTVTGITAEAPIMAIDGEDLAVAGTITVDEQARRNDVVGRLSISNQQQGQNFTYELVEGAGDTGNQYFSVGSGYIRVLDTSNMTLGEYTIRVQASLSSGDEAGDYTVIENITFNLVDTTAPVIIGDSDRTGDSSNFKGRVAAGVADGLEVGITVYMHSADVGQVTFSLSDDAEGRFQIDENTGVVTVKGGSQDGSRFDYSTNASHTIVVVASDAAGNKDTQSYDIRVLETTASAVDDTGSATEERGRSGNLLNNDNDIDGNDNALQVVAVNGEAANLATSIAGSHGGLFTVDASGNWTFDPNDDFAHVANRAEFSTSIQVTVRDSLGLESTSVLTIIVQGDNETPTNFALSNDTYNLSPTNRVVGDLSVTDEDTNDEHTYSINRDNSGAFEIVDTQLLVKEGVDIAVGSYDITLMVNDGSTNVTQNFTIEVVDETAPVFGDNLDLNTAGDSESAQGDVLDGAGAGTEVGITANAEDAHDVTYSLADDAEGRFVIDAQTGVISVAQGITINLSDATFFDITVRAEDTYTNASQQVYRISVTDAPPVAVDDTATVTEVETASGNLLINDTNPNESHDLLEVSAINDDDANIGVVVDGDNGGQFTINADGAWSFTPDPGFNALQSGQSITTSVQITVVDSRGSSADSTLSITVNGENDAPDSLTLSNNLVALDSETLVIGELAGNDPDTGDSLSYSLVEVDDDAADNAYFAINGSQLTLTNPAIGAGNATVHIAVTDAGGLSYVQTFNIIITETVAFEITGDTNALGDDSNGVYNGVIRANATSGTEVGITVEAEYSLDSDADITFSLTDNADGRFQIDSETGVVTVASGATFDVSLATTHTITVQAEVGGASRVTQAFVIAIAPATLAVGNDTATTTEHGAVGSDTAGNVFANDGNQGDYGLPTAVTAIGGYSGAIGNPVAGSEGGSFTVNADGSWSFDAGTDFDILDAGDSLTTQITLTFTTELAETFTSTLSVTVNGEADDPTNVRLDSTLFDLADGVTKVGNLLADDVDTPPEDRTATLPDLPDTDNALFEVIAGELHVKSGVTLEARTSYTVTIEVSDGQGTARTTETISVVDSDTPFITGDSDTTNDAADNSYQGAIDEGAYGASTTVGIQAVTDHSDAVTFSIINDDQNPNATDSFKIDPGTGVISVKADVTLNAETATQHAVTVQVQDDQSGNSSTRTFIINVNNLAPQAESDTQSVSTEMTETSGNLFTNDSDAGSDMPLSDDIAVTQVGGVADNVGQTIAGSNGGTFTIMADGTWTFTLGSDFTGLQPGQSVETSISVQITDKPAEGNGQSDTSLLTVTVREPADLSLSNNQLDLAQTGTDEIGTLALDDTTGTGPYTFTLVDGEGGDNNAMFSITGDKLSVVRSDPLQDAGTYSIRVQLDDGVTTSIAVFNIDLLNTTESFNLTDTNSLNDRGNDTKGTGAVTEGATNGTSVGITVAADQPRLPLTFSLTDNAGGRFAIDQNTGEIRVLDGSLINAEDGVVDYRVTAKAVEATTGLEAEYTFSIYLDNLALSAQNDTGATTASASTPISGNVFDNDSDVNSTLPGDDVVVLAAGGDVDAKIAEVGEAALADNMTGLYGVGVGVGQQIAGSEGGIFTLASDGRWTFDPNGDFDRLADGTTRVSVLTVVVADQGLGQGEGDAAVVAALPDYVNGMVGEQQVTRISVTVTGEYVGPDFNLLDTDTGSNYGDLASERGTVAENAANGDTVGITVGADVADLPLSFELLDNAGGRFAIDATTGVVTVADNTLLNAEHASLSVFSITIKATDTESLKTAEVTLSVQLQNSELVALDDTGTTTENAAAPITGNVFDNDQDANSTLPSNDAVVLSAGDTVSGLTIADGKPVLTSADLGQGLSQNLTGSNGGIFTVAADGSWSFDPNGDFEFLANGETQVTRISVLVADQGLAQSTSNLTLPAHVTGNIGQPVVSEIIVTVQGENDAPYVVGEDNPAFTISATQGQPLNYVFDTAKIADPDSSHVHSNRQYSLADGQTLPDGLEVILAEPPRMVGTPTVSGDFSFRVRATDPDGLSTFFTMQINIEPAVAPPNDIITSPPADPAPVDNGQPPRDTINSAPSRLGPAQGGDNGPSPLGGDIQLTSPVTDTGGAPAPGQSAPEGDNFNPEPFGPAASGNEGQNGGERGTQPVELPDGQLINPLPSGANLDNYILDVSADLDNQLSTVGLNFAYEIPEAAFVFTSGNEQFVGELTLSATQADGSPLPSWLTFDPKRGVFEGTPSEGDEETLNIRVTAEAANGQTVEADFQINVSEQPVETEQGNEQASTEAGAEELEVAAQQLEDQDAQAELAQEAGKAAFTEQLAKHAAQDNLVAQQQLLEQLAKFKFDATTAS
ncbi:MAG: DUF4347 domain-containing protein [Pontibacterium sp.]